MRRLALLALCATVLAPVALPLPSAHAQGDWQVKRDPFDRRIINRYKALLARNPGDAGALAKLVRLYKSYRTIDLLIEEYGKELDKDADDASAHLVLGHILLGENRAEEALAHYQKAAALSPDDAGVQIALGALYKRMGQAAEARAAYEKALASARKSAVKKDILKELAELALAGDDIAGAKRFYEQYIELDPRDVQARIDLGDALMRHNLHADAVTAFKEAETRLGSDPARRVQVISRLGAAYEGAGDEDQAVAQYKRAIAMVSQSYYIRRELTERIIDIFRRRQELPALIAEYEKDWPERRRKHFEWDILARLYEETGASDQAIDAFRKATKKAPYELDTQRRLIALLENSGREDEAIAQYEIVIKVAPGEPRFQLELAQRYWERGEEKKALDLLEKIERRFPGDGGVHAAVADLYTRWGKEDRALEAYVRLTQIEPDEVSHLVNLGEQYFQRGQKDKAIAIWKRIIRRKTAGNYARLGEVYAEHDMLDEALDMFARGIKLEPDNPDLYKGRAGVYERKRRWDEAISDWDKVLALIPNTGANKPARRDARRRIVNVLRRAKGSKLNDRMTLWRRAYYADPADLESGWFLIEAHLRLNRFNQAARELERMLTLTPEDTEAMHELVKVYRREMDHDKAVALLLRLAELSPGREREYYTQISEIKTENREDDEAIKYAQMALDKSPNDPIAHQRLAERYQEMQNFGAAIASYERAIELDKRNFRVYFTLAELYKYTYQLPRAAELYREVLRRASDEEILQKAGREAIDLEEMLPSLGELEKVVAPLAFTFAHKPVYRRILVELYDRYVPILIERWRRGSPEERTAARAELDRLGAHGLKPLLEALNDDTDVAQQRIAVSVLGYLGNRSAAAPLVKLASAPTQNDDLRRKRIGTLVPTLDWDVRVQALVAAGRLGDPRTIPKLIALADHREVAMREAAVFALGMTGDRKALAPVLERTRDRSESVQAMACLSLARLGDDGAVDRLIEMTGERRLHDITRAACAYALGTIDAGNAAGALADTLAEGNGELQRMSAWALGMLADKRQVPALLSVYFGRREAIRETIAWALERIESGSIAAPVIDPHASDYPTLNGKFDAGAAIAALPGELPATPLPVDLVAGHETEIVAGLRESFGRHRDLIVRVLRDLVRGDGRLALGPLTAGHARASAAEQKRMEAAIDRIAAAIAPDLVALVGHRDPTVRGLALTALARSRATEVAPTLIAAIDDSEASVRRAAMEAAAERAASHPDEAAGLARVIAERLTAEAWDERRDAADVLGRFGSHADAGALVTALADSNDFVREKAAASLGRLGARAAVEPLADIAGNDAVPEVRIAAIEALAAIGDPAARPVLERLAGAGDDEVARAAKRALRTWKK